MNITEYEVLLFSLMFDVTLTLITLNLLALQSNTLYYLISISP